MWFNFGISCLLVCSFLLQNNMFYRAFVFHHYVFALMQNFFELKVDTPQLDNTHYVCEMASPNNGTICRIPVRLPKSEEIACAFVDCDDYEKIMQVSPTWRANSKGYVVSSKRVEGKNKMTYMHRLIVDKPSMHLNGNKFDNRKENLLPTNRGTKRNRDDEFGFEIKTISPLLDFKLPPAECPENSKHSTIQYPGNVTYSGEIHNFKPHGFGTLTEENKTSIGWWLQGIFKHGLVISLKPIPSCLRLNYSIPQIRYAVMVLHEKAVKF